MHKKDRHRRGTVQRSIYWSILVTVACHWLEKYIYAKISCFFARVPRCYETWHVQTRFDSFWRKETVGLRCDCGSQNVIATSAHAHHVVYADPPCERNGLGVAADAVDGIILSQTGGEKRIITAAACKCHSSSSQNDAKRGSCAVFCNEAVSVVWQGTKSL